VGRSVFHRGGRSVLVPDGASAGFCVSLLRHRGLRRAHPGVEATAAGRGGSPRRRRASSSSQSCPVRAIFA